MGLHLREYQLCAQIRYIRLTMVIYISGAQPTVNKLVRMSCISDTIRRMKVKISHLLNLGELLFVWTGISSGLIRLTLFNDTSFAGQPT